MANANIRLCFTLCLVAASVLLIHFEGLAEAEGDGTPDKPIGSPVGSGTDDNTVKREEEAVSYDGFSVKEKQMIEATTENFEYQAEVSRLMGLIINSLYSNKEIFLREVISNASDALDKIRFMSVTDKSVLGEGETANLEIRIKANPDQNTLTIMDRGIGMTKEDLVNNLGTVASSGTKKFVEKVMSGGDENSDTSGLIGQFGVGFYSVFLVADEVSVISKNNDDDQYVWTSTADNNFKIAKDPRGNTIGRGTEITLKLKDDALEYLDEEILEKLVKKYSEFINFPIYLWKSHEEDKEVDLTEEELKAQEEEEETDDESEEVDAEGKDEEAKDEEDKAEEEKEPKKTTKTVKEKVYQYEVINSSKPIWTRNKEDITEDEYTEFFKALTKSEDAPLTHVHFKAEGEVDFRSILYIPEKAPADLFQNYGVKPKNVKLYVRRVFITDDFEDILPKYLNFVKGMVDSDNLPLNVSREMLQQHKMLKTIKKKLTRKTLEMIKKLAKEDEEAFEKFWKEFGTSIKLGLIEDTANRTKIAKLLRFKSSKSGDKFTSLEDYVSRMKDSQKNIYYLAGESQEQLEKSPYLERLLKKGLECLYLTAPVDEYAINSLPEFDGKKLMNVGKEGLELDEEDTSSDEEEEFSELIVFLKTHLSEKIEKAVISKRLYTSPSALVTGYFGYTPNMERIMKAQALAGSDSNAQFQMDSKKNMEINPRHPLIKELNKRLADDSEDPVVKDMATLLYDTARLSSGYNIGDDATAFTKRVHRFMMLGLDIPEDGMDAEKDEALEAESTAAAEEDAKRNAGEEKDEDDVEEELESDSAEKEEKVEDNKDEL